MLRWHAEIKSQRTISEPLIFIVGCKSDLGPPIQTVEENVKAFVNQNEDLLFHMKVSGKTGDNVETLFEDIGTQLLHRSAEQSPAVLVNKN